MGYVTDAPAYVHEKYELMEEYKKQFGEHSLDRVLMAVDPNKEETFRESIEDLKKAMETNTPLEQISEEMLDVLIF